MKTADQSENTDDKQELVVKREEFPGHIEQHAAKYYYYYY